MPIKLSMKKASLGGAPLLLIVGAHPMVDTVVEARRD